MKVELGGSGKSVMPSLIGKNVQVCDAKMKGGSVFSPSTSSLGCKVKKRDFKEGVAIAAHNVNRTSGHFSVSINRAQVSVLDTLSEYH